jgi:dTDP-4-dehydrorhamnose reductase
MISANKMIKKRILIVGSNGMLGQRLTEYFLKKKNVELMCCSNEENSFIKNVDYIRFDITNKNKVKNIFQDFYPDAVINTAAFTNVDLSETERETAYNVNVTGVDNLALYSKSIESHLIHISTDYVFDGTNGPYSEKQKPNPISYYGRTKLASENTVKSRKCDASIIRTNVLYGPAKYGRNDFVKWVVTSLREGKQIRIVTDQINNPTYIDDLVDAIAKMIEFKKYGLYNIGGKEFLSRYDFTLRIADFFDLDKSLIVPIKTADLNQPAPRPLKSGLVTLKAETELGYKPQTIETTFRLMKNELKL